MALNEKQITLWIVFIVILQSAWWLIALGVVIIILLHFHVIPLLGADPFNRASYVKDAAY